MEVTDYVTLDNSPYSQVVFLKCETGGRGGPCAQCTGSVHLGRLGRHGPAFGCLTPCEAEFCPEWFTFFSGTVSHLLDFWGAVAPFQTLI